MIAPRFVIALALAQLAWGSAPASDARTGMLSAIEQRRRDAEQMYSRGRQLVERTVLPPDYAAAAEFYRQAAEAGYAPAQYDLARFYSEGLGVECDQIQAAKWYRRAAEQGDAEARNNLGTLYASGRGVPRSDVEAARWYSLAAEQDNPEAQSNLGMMYLRGRGVSRDLQHAFELFLHSAQNGHAIAQNNLALMYANGHGVERDYVRAWAWLDIAAGELPAATELRKQVGKEMTPEEIERAGDLAAQYRANITRRAGRGL